MSALFLTYPTVTDGVTVVDAVIHNANFPEIQTAVNSIDHTNMGPAGIYATSLIPTTNAQAIFGTGAAGVGYKFLANDATATPLTVSGVAGQSVDIFDVTLTSGGTKALFVNQVGDFGIATGASSARMFMGTAVGTSGLFTFDGTNYNFFNAGFSSAKMTITAATGAVTTNGSIIAQTGFMAATGSASFSAPSTSAIGDGIFQRTASTGASFLGGATDFAAFDYALNTALKVSIKRAGGSYCDLNAGVYTNASDKAFKADIAAVPHGIDAVMALKPSTYTIKSNGRTGLGFIAQDVQGVLPELVSVDNDGMLGVNYDGIIPVLVNAVQQLSAKMDAYVAAHP